ncbi:MAG: amidohydrolase family protein [Clostridia bacterium]|nr:amidohydrolase family protein [Clostridia bacterium]
MLIDIHTHAFPDRVAGPAFEKLSQAAGIPTHLPGTLGALSDSSRAAGFGLSVVQPVATNPLKVSRLNAFAADINRRSAETGLLSFAALHPLSPTLAEDIREIAALGFRGVKLHPVYQDTPVDEPAFLKALEGCYTAGLAVLVHGGYDIGLPGKDTACVARIRRMLRALPPQRLVLAHMGGWGEWDQMDYLGLPGLYLDTAFCLRTGCETFLTPEDMRSLIRRHGPERVLFGTDSPWNPQAEELQRIRSLGLTAEEERLILGENALRLLGLDQA